VCGSGRSSTSMRRGARSVGGFAGTTRAGHTKPSGISALDNTGLNNSTWWLDDEGALHDLGADEIGSFCGDGVMDSSAPFNEQWDVCGTSEQMIFRHYAAG
jgi:hypothetical protein